MSEPFVPLAFPSWIQWGVRKGAILRQPQGVGPNGRRLCRWCGSEVPPRSQSWCSRSCVGSFQRVWSWGALSQYVRDRDRACQRCGAEHPGWNPSRSTEHRYVFVYAYPRGYNASYCDLREWWEVDHIRRVTDGGTDDPANLRLLCHSCHVTVGYEQRAAAKRTTDPQMELSA